MLPESVKQVVKKRLGIVFLVALSLCSGGCRKAASGPAPPEVAVASPVQRDISIYSDWIGTTVGFVDAEIHSEVTGYLLSQNYKEGSLVKKGDLLFQVDPKPFQALVDQAKAHVEAAQTQLTEARAEVDQAKAEIERAQANLTKTELDVKRYLPLVSDGTVSQQEADDAVQANQANQSFGGGRPRPTWKGEGARGDGRGRRECGQERSPGGRTQP
jgi:membrane fusion protein (multidrug efflux system)